MKDISKWFLRLAVFYFVVGVALGLYMAATHNFTMRPAHVHLNLLGWVSMLLFGLYYHLFPATTKTTLAKLHFAIYIPAHFGQMVLLIWFYSGDKSIEPALALASTLVGVAVLCFAGVVWKQTK